MLRMFWSFEAGSTDYKIARASVKNLTDSDLLTAAQHALENHKGRLYPADLRDYAKQKKPLHASHRPFQALPESTMTPEARKAACKKMREEVGI